MGKKEISEAAALHRQGEIRRKALEPRGEWWRDSPETHPRIRAAMWAVIEHFERVDADERSKLVIGNAIEALCVPLTKEPVAWRYRTKNSIGQWSMWVVTSEEPLSDLYEYEAVPLFDHSAPNAEEQPG